MNWQLAYYSCILLCAGFLALGLAVYSWSKRSTRGAVPLIATTLCVSVWCLSYGLVLSSDQLVWRILSAKIQYIGIAGAPLCLFLMVLELTGRSSEYPRTKMYFISFWAVLCVVLAWTNEFHGLIWVRESLRIEYVDGIPFLYIKHGVYFWFHVVFSYTLLLLSFIFLVEMWLQEGPLKKKQAALFLLGASFPWMGNIFFLLQTSLTLDWTPFGYFISVLFLVWGVLRYRLFALMPIARKEVIESLCDGIIILDSDTHIVEANSMARAFLVKRSEHWLGASIALLIPEINHFYAHLDEEPSVDFSLHVDGVHRTSYYDVYFSKIHGHHEDILGYIIVLRDMTQQRDNEDALRRLAMTDGLTGLLNRRTFYEFADPAFSLAQRYEKPLSILMLDLDHFKSINDTHGHAIGDLVLQKVTHQLSELKRKSDILARYGGEEFIMLMPETTCRQAALAAERFVQSVRPELILSQELSLYVTMSVGVAAFSPSLNSLECVIKAADDALYTAKREGRNQVCICSEGVDFIEEKSEEVML